VLARDDLPWCECGGKNCATMILRAAVAKAHAFSENAP